MDPKFALRFILVLLLTSPLFVTGNMQAEAVQPYEETKKHEPSRMINVGYHAMSLTLDMVLDAINPNATLTLFCPQDKAFFKSKYPQPPLTLLKYHALLFKMDKDSMDASFRHVTEWDLYNNGRLIAHGVEDFFDPAFQILRYPQYDVIAKDVVSSGVAAASTLVLVLVFFFCAKPSKTDDFQYCPLWRLGPYVGLAVDANRRR
ncbi:unnamed protein product [Malus baccata var. baccata]